MQRGRLKIVVPGTPDHEPHTVCLLIVCCTRDILQESVVTRRRAGGPAEGQVRGADIQGGRSAENEQHAGGERKKSVYRREPRPGRSVRASVVRRADRKSQPHTPDCTYPRLPPVPSSYLQGRPRDVRVFVSVAFSFYFISSVFLFFFFLLLFCSAIFFSINPFSTRTRFYFIFIQFPPIYTSPLVEQKRVKPTRENTT